MSKHVRSLAVGIVLTVVFLYFFGRSVAWKEVPAQIVDVNIPLFLLTIPLSVFHFVTRSLRWQVLIAREKPDVRFRNLVAANIVGFTVNAVVPGRLGELVRPLYLARKEGLRRASPSARSSSSGSSTRSPTASSSASSWSPGPCSPPPGPSAARRGRAWSPGGRAARSWPRSFSR